MGKESYEARHAVLTAIRRHLRASAPFDEEKAGHAMGARRHETTQPEESSSLLERFKQSLEAVGGHCLVARSETEALSLVLQVVEKLGAKRIAISDSPRVRRVMSRLGTDVELLERAAKADLFKCEVGVTGAQWAIAETGTLVLESGRERHRLASLVPPVHVAIVEAGRIRQTMREVLQSIGAEDEQAFSRTVTFITGPSRTSDIELTLAIGVHGPAELYVVLIVEEES